MADDKKKAAAKPGAKKPSAPPEKKVKKALSPEKAAKAAEAEAAKEAAKKEKAAAPRPPVDPRVKVLKKFQGKFLPKGTLRTRHQEILARWNSGDDHGNVTLDELKSLLDAWKAARAKPAAKA